MLNIKPKTYNEVVCLSKCLEVRKYIFDLSDEIIEKMYNHINNNPQNRISITPDMITYINATNVTVGITVLPPPKTDYLFDRIVFDLAAFNVVKLVLKSKSDGGCSSGCSSGCSGGCSGNNNNNNNS